MKAFLSKFFLKCLGLFALSSLCTQTIFAQTNTGDWQTIGYGYVFSTVDDVTTGYDVTSISAIPSLEGYMSFDSLFIDGNYFGSFAIRDEKFLIDAPNGNVYFVERPDSIPEPLTEDPEDPQLVFDILWQTHQEYSALLHILDIDWEAIRDTLRPQLTDSTDDETLFAVLEAMLEPLNDGHSALLDFENESFYSGGPNSSPYWILGLEGDALVNSIILNYMEGNATLTESGNIGYGPIGDSLAYINVTSMGGYATDEDASEIEQNEAFKTEITEAFEALKDQQALILDIRFNGGGFDMLARTLASYLTTERRLAYTKQARVGEIDQFTDSIPFFIEPLEATYFADKPIIVLTSDFTASAAEILTLCLNEIPNVTTMGEATYGIFSDAIPKILPNGWFFTFSPERYRSAEGTNYEQLGIPPDIEIRGDSALIAAGTDNILERAIQELEALTTSIRTAEFFQGQSRVFPNPFSNALKVDFMLVQDTELAFTLYNMHGQILQQRESQRYGQGSHVLDWDTQRLAPGSYFLQIQSGGKTVTHTIVRR